MVFHIPWLLCFQFCIVFVRRKSATCKDFIVIVRRSTRQATFAHNYCVELSNARINRLSDGFFPSTSHLWNSLPFAVFPASFNLPSFKSQVYHHLRDQMA